MKNQLGCILSGLLLAIVGGEAQTVDLAKQYPTTLPAGDADPSRARPWEVTTADVYSVERFSFKLDTNLVVETGPADLGVGHSTDGAVWALVMPRQGGKLTSSVATQPEPVAQVWLRFHPAEIGRLFPAETVVGPGAANLVPQMKDIAHMKMHSSWQAGRRALIPEPKDMTVDVDTKGGPRRFFVVDTAAGKAEYVAAFAGEGAASQEISLSAAPPVVIKTFPLAGSEDVDPSLTEIRVTYSKPMLNNSWSWSTWGEENFPEMADKPHYLADGRTCVLPVKLKPGKFYAIWLNSNKFKNFKDADQRPAVPYLLTFRTAGEAGSEGAK